MRTLSIVTPVLNRAKTISRALESASQLKQATAWDVDHLVMDGGSTDGTLDEIARFEHEVSVYSEEDEGLYEAINRGIERATGQYVWLLNSDDELIPAMAARLLEEIEEAGFPQAAWGGAEVATQDADRSSGTGQSFEVFRGTVHGPISVISVMMGTPIINARILERELYSQLGGFDPHLRIASDREFLIRLAQADVEAITFDRPIYRYHAYEDSLTIREGRASRETLHEYIRVAETYAYDRSVSVRVRAAARAWEAWNRFLLDAPVGSRSVTEIAKMERWKSAPSRSALGAAVLAKGWCKGSITLRSLFTR